jgi:fluoride exporter
VRALLLVGFGGFFGSILRYLSQGGIYRWIEKPWIPWGTLAVNVVGCFALGFLAELAQTRQIIGPQLRLFLFIGVLGGFTTFSTFGFETFALARDGQWGSFVGNVGLHLLLCLGAVWAGTVISRLL